MARTDDRHRFGGGEEAVLVERLVDRQTMPPAEEPFQIFLRYMAVPGGDIDNEARNAGFAVDAVVSLTVDTQESPRGTLLILPTQNKKWVTVER